ncbi:MAG: hypothetical protein IKY94_11395 [Lachnospiraceae bacterium]|nr:hypothetical protein [Lachnospiraceae bacterium]
MPDRDSFILGTSYLQELINSDLNQDEENRWKISVTEDVKIYKGDTFLCTKTVEMEDDGEKVYIKGKIYVSQQDSCITNERGETNHYWDNISCFDEHFVRICKI